jgi:hypothetical protein
VWINISSVYVTPPFLHLFLLICYWSILNWIRLLGDITPFFAGCKTIPFSPIWDHLQSSFFLSSHFFSPQVILNVYLWSLAEEYSVSGKKVLASLMWGIISVIFLADIFTVHIHDGDSFETLSIKFCRWDRLAFDPEYCWSKFYSLAIDNIRKCSSYHVPMEGRKKDSSIAWKTISFKYMKLASHLGPIQASWLYIRDNFYISSHHCSYSL